MKVFLNYLPGLKRGVANFFNKVSLTEALAMSHRLLDMYKEVPKIFNIVKGAKAFEKDREVYRCRFLDIFGNRVECHCKGNSVDMSLGVVLTCINPVQIFDCIAFNTKVNFSLLIRSQTTASSDSAIRIVASRTLATSLEISRAY
jgi:hypothetical protein